MAVYFRYPLLTPWVFFKIACWTHRAVFENRKNWSDDLNCSKYKGIVVTTTLNPVTLLVEVLEVCVYFTIPADLPERLLFLLQMQGKVGHVHFSKKDSQMVAVVSTDGSE